MARTKIVKDFEEGKPVDTQEIAKAMGVLVVTAPFELKLGYKVIQYQKGDTFNIPEDWTRDFEFEEFRKSKNGLAFSEPVPVLDEKGNLKYLNSRRVILPLKEA